jgi:hypothetical protein
MEGGGGTPGQANETKWPDFDQRLHEIYGDKVAPDSQNTIDEGRGDRSLAQRSVHGGAQKANSYQLPG